LMIPLRRLLWKPLAGSLNLIGLPPIALAFVGPECNHCNQRNHCLTYTP
jgi:hypothetical protein